jgi:hypothetical protein
MTTEQQPSSSNSSLSQDIGLSLSSIDVVVDHHTDDANANANASSLHEKLTNLVVAQRGTITSSERCTKVNHDDSDDAVPSLPNPDGLPRPIHSNKLSVNHHNVPFM